MDSTILRLESGARRSLSLLGRLLPHTFRLFERKPDWKVSLQNTEGERAKYLGELFKRFLPPNSSSLPFSPINFASVIRMSLFRGNQRLRIRVRVFDSRLRRSFQTSFLSSYTIQTSGWLRFGGAMREVGLVLSFASRIRYPLRFRNFRQTQRN